MIRILSVINQSDKREFNSQWEILYLASKWFQNYAKSDLNIFKISLPRRAAWGLRETSSSSHRGPYSESGLSLANLKTKNKSSLIQTFQTWKQPKPTQFWFGANFSIISTFDKNLENAKFLKNCNFNKKWKFIFLQKYQFMSDRQRRNTGLSHTYMKGWLAFYELLIFRELQFSSSTRKFDFRTFIFEHVSNRGLKTVWD